MKGPAWNYMFQLISATTRKDSYTVYCVLIDTVRLFHFQAHCDFQDASLATQSSFDYFSMRELLLRNCRVYLGLFGEQWVAGSLPRDHGAEKADPRKRMKRKTKRILDKEPSNSWGGAGHQTPFFLNKFHTMSAGGFGRRESGIDFIFRGKSHSDEIL